MAECQLKGINVLCGAVTSYAAPNCVMHNGVSVIYGALGPRLPLVIQAKNKKKTNTEVS